MEVGFLQLRADEKGIVPWQAPRGPLVGERWSSRGDRDCQE